MEHDVLLPGDELAGPELRDHTAVQAALFEHVDPAEVRVRVAESGAADESFDLAVGERGVGVVDGELDAFLEHHPEGEGVVLDVEGVDQGRGAHLPQLALGLGVEAAHRDPPA